MDADFKAYHFKVVDLIEEDLEWGQAVLDEDDDRVIDLSYRLRQLLSPNVCDSKAEPVANTIEAIETTPDTGRCLLQQHDEQVNYITMELIDTSRQMASIDEDTSELEDLEKRISKAIFKTSLQARRQLQSLPPVLLKDSIKLPKIDVPTFDGNVMNWHSFWEQYQVLIHSKTQLADPEKLAYL